MNEISRGLETPYYEAVITSYQEIDEMNGHVRTAHEMIALATRQRGFLGLETSRSPSGKPVVVSYWTSLDAVEAWQARAMRPSPSVTAGTRGTTIADSKSTRSTAHRCASGCGTCWSGRRPRR